MLQRLRVAYELIHIMSPRWAYRAEAFYDGGARLSSYDRELLPCFPLFPIEGLLELDAKEGRKFFGGSLETAELVRRHLYRITGGIGHRALRSAARVASTGMDARQGSDDVHILMYSG